MKNIVFLMLVILGAGLTATAQTPLKRDSLRRATVIGAMPGKKDMVVISTSEIPQPLKNTLERVEYQGWESGKFYRTKLNDMFLVEFKRGNRLMSYHFDVNGTPLDP